MARCVFPGCGGEVWRRRAAVAGWTRAIAAALTVAAGGAPAAAEPFSLAVLPDTQVYARAYPELFADQTRWIAENAADRNIRYVLHVGDVTDNNNTLQFDRARAAFDQLHQPGGGVAVPYAIAPGNHDYGPNGNGGNRDTLFDDDRYFGDGSPYGRQPGLGGTFEPGRTDNSYHLFSAGGRDWIILALEFGPRDAVVDWADGVLTQHAGREAILLTHAYLFSSEARYDDRIGQQSWNPNNYGIASSPEGVNDGQQLFEKLVSKHDIALTLNGHVLNDGVARRTDVTASGRLTHQMLVNFQTGPRGGDGFMRLLEFSDDGQVLTVGDFSPTTGQRRDDPDHRFHLPLSREAMEPDPRRAVREHEPVVFRHGPAGSGSAATPGEAGKVPAAGAWSVAAWVRPGLLTPGASVLSAGGNGGSARLTLVPGDAGGEELYWAIEHAGDAGATRLASVHAAQAGRWTHLAAAADGDRVRLFVNGELVGEAAAGGLALDAGAVRLGGGAATGGGLVGRVGEAAVFDRALGFGDVVEQHLASFNRVIAGHIDVLAPTDPGGNARPGLDEIRIGAQSLPGLSLSSANRGDYALHLGSGWRYDADTLVGTRAAVAAEGVMLATVRRTGRHDTPATVEAGWSSFSDGVIALSVMEAGREMREINSDAAVAWFPFAAGWVGGHFDAGGTLITGRGIDPGSVTPNVGGRAGEHRLELGVDARAAGLLFTIGGANADHVVNTAVRDDGSGWDIVVRDNAAGLADGGSASPFSVLYMPIDAPGLIGGRYDGEAGVSELSAGAFTMTRLGAGEYRLVIPGESPETGVLLLTVAHEATEVRFVGGFRMTTGVNDNALEYGPDGSGGFVIRSRDLSSLALEDTAFSWAFVGFDGTLAVPEPAPAGVVALGLVLLLFRRGALGV